MAKFTLWTPEQMQERSKPKRMQQREARERAIAEYSEYLKGATPGFGGQLELDSGEDKRKVRAMVREAADKHGLNLRFRPIKDKTRIEFHVTDTEEQPKAPAGGTRRGRPKKSQE
jgi:hypothetical protein